MLKRFSSIILTVMLMLTLLLVGCSGTLQFNVDETDGGYSGDFDVIIDTPTDVPSTPVPNTPVPTDTPVEPTPTREVLTGLDFILTASLNYRTSPEVASNFVATLPTNTQGEALTWYQGSSYVWLYVDVVGYCPNGGWIALTSRVNLLGADYRSLPEITEPFSTAPCSLGGSSLNDGFNYNAAQISNQDYALAIADLNCASGHLVMNGIWWADRLYESMVEAGCPPPVIVIRSYQTCEGDCYATLSPQQVINDWCARAVFSPYADQYLWEAINEPPTNQRLLDWTIAVSNLAATKPCGIDFIAALPAWGVGRVKTEEIDRGIYDELGRTLYKNGDVLSVHNYFLGVPASGWGQLNGDQLLEPVITGNTAFLRANYCPTNLDWSLDGYNTSEPHTWYHMGREWRLIQRWYALGYTNIPVVITEFGTDTLQDVRGRDWTGQLRPVNDILRDAYGHDVRGIQHYQEYYQAIFPTLSFGQAIDLMFDCAVSQYPAYNGRESGYMLIASFTWSNSQDWVLTGFGLDGTLGEYSGAIREWHTLTE